MNPRAWCHFSSFREVLFATAHAPIGQTAWCHHACAPSFASYRYQKDISRSLNIWRKYVYFSFFFLCHCFDLYDVFGRAVPTVVLVQLGFSCDESKPRPPHPRADWSNLLTPGPGVPTYITCKHVICIHLSTTVTMKLVRCCGNRFIWRYLNLRTQVNLNKVISAKLRLEKYTTMNGQSRSAIMHYLLSSP